MPITATIGDTDPWGEQLLCGGLRRRTPCPRGPSAPATPGGGEQLIGKLAVADGSPTCRRYAPHAQGKTVSIFSRAMRMSKPLSSPFQWRMVPLLELLMTKRRWLPRRRQLRSACNRSARQRQS